VANYTCSELRRKHVRTCIFLRPISLEQRARKRNWSRSQLNLLRITPSCVRPPHNLLLKNARVKIMRRPIHKRILSQLGSACMYNQCGCEKLEKWGDHWWNYVFAMAPRAGLYVRCFCTQHALGRPVGRQLSRSLAPQSSLCVYNLITGWHKSAPGPAIIGVWRRGHNPDWPTSNPQGHRIVFSAGAIELTLNQKQYVHCHQDASTGLNYYQ